MCKERKPSVSVIIPTYNRAHLIGRAIQSVLNQTYQDFEIIIVNDGSSDNTEDIIKAFNEERIRYIGYEENKGAAAAINIGIMAARGQYIAFQDSDDEWLPEKLEKQMRVFKDTSPEVGVVYTGFWKIKGNHRVYIPSKQITRKEGDVHTILLAGNFVTNQAAVVKTECFGKVGMFDERLPRLVDWELFLRISEYYQFKCIDEPLMIAYLQPDSISADRSAFIKALKLILEKHFKDFDKDKRALAGHFSAIGRALCSDGQLKQGRKYLIKAVTAYPLNIKPLLATLVSLLGQDAYNRAAASYGKTRNWWSRSRQYTINTGNTGR